MQIASRCSPLRRARTQGAHRAGQEGPARCAPWAPSRPNPSPLFNGQGRGPAAATPARRTPPATTCRQPTLQPPRRRQDRRTAAIATREQGRASSNHDAALSASRRTVRPRPRYRPQLFTKRARLPEARRTERPASFDAAPPLSPTRAAIRSVSTLTSPPAQHRPSPRETPVSRRPPTASASHPRRRLESSNHRPGVFPNASSQGRRHGGL